MVSPPIILGIESSCDETAAAVLAKGKLLGQCTASQMIHAAYGGVVPELAARAHQQWIIPVVQESLQRAGITAEEIGAIAVTEGPGLLGSLLVGTSFANGWAWGAGIPLIGVHHTRAHLLANWLEPPYPSLPAVGLIASGGHTQLVWVTSPTTMELLGSTLDDAVGEAFDKVAKMIGFPYPGGQYIEQCAKGGNPQRFAFPMPKVKGLHFSFSGLKTAFRYFLEKNKMADPHFLEREKADLSASIQRVLIEALVQKAMAAMEMKRTDRLLRGGGCGL